MDNERINYYRARSDQTAQLAEEAMEAEAQLNEEED